MLLFDDWFYFNTSLWANNIASWLFQGFCYKRDAGTITCKFNALSRLLLNSYALKDFKG